MSFSGRCGWIKKGRKDLFRTGELEYLSVNRVEKGREKCWRGVFVLRLRITEEFG